MKIKRFKIGVVFVFYPNFDVNSKLSLKICRNLRFYAYKISKFGVIISTHYKRFDWSYNLSENNLDYLPKNSSISLERVATANLPTQFGEFKIAGYRLSNSNEEFVVLFKGEMRNKTLTLVRIHSQCLIGDIFGSIKCDSGLQLKKAL